MASAHLGRLELTAVASLARIARPLVANGTLKQTGADRIAHTAFSKMLATPNPIWAMAQLG
jgi:hypothetical protein